MLQKNLNECVNLSQMKVQNLSLRFLWENKRPRIMRVIKKNRVKTKPALILARQ